MSYHARFQEASISNHYLITRNALIIGGTQGIGAACAVRLASLGANVAIAGRNKAKADEVIAEMRVKFAEFIALQRNTDKSAEEKITDPIFEFFPVDVSSMADIHRFVQDSVAKRYDNDGLDILLLTAGRMLYGDRTETKEGFEESFALHYLGRFLATYLCLPYLLKAKGGHPKVLSIFSAAHGDSVPLDDIQLKKASNFSLNKRAASTAILNDIIAMEFTRRYKGHPSDIAFYHLFPGFVSTGVVENSQWPRWMAKSVSWLASPFATKPEHYAEVPTHVILAGTQSYPSGSLINSTGGIYKTPAFITKNPNCLAEVWKQSADLIGIHEQ